MTFLVFFAAPARAGVVAADLGLGPVDRLAVHQEVGIEVFAVSVVMAVVMVVITVGTVDVRMRGARSGAIVSCHGGNLAYSRLADSGNHVSSERFSLLMNSTARRSRPRWWRITASSTSRHAESTAAEIPVG